MRSNFSLKLLVWKILRFADFGGFILRYYPKSYLRNQGWFLSYRQMQSVDQEGLPIPWLTYAFLDFFEARLNREFRLFEYGCGYSTVWYAQRVKEIVAVESNGSWVEKISSQLPSNGKVIYCTEPDRYAKEIRNYSPFDVVIIDGILREKCWEPAMQSLTPDGVIIWDNSDRDDFREGFEHLKKYGFREIPFSGLAPSDFVMSRTSILYRQNNCLGI